MKIGVISDTHLQEPNRELSNLTATVFRDVSMILHAGDITRMAVLEAFSEKQTVAVCGNMDQADVADRLNVTELITVQGYRIGLVHGWGSAKGVEEKIFKAFDDPHVIVYGHTHKPAIHKIKNTLMFNPGSFSGSFPFKQNRSVGILHIGGEGIKGEIISL